MIKSPVSFSSSRKVSIRSVNRSRLMDAATSGSNFRRSHSACSAAAFDDAAASRPLRNSSRKSRLPWSNPPVGSE